MKYLFVILLSIELFAQFEDFVKYNTIESDRFLATFSNDGRLVSDKTLFHGIYWPKNELYSSLVYEHGIWTVGFRNDTLIGVVYQFKPGYTPGPIISNQPAIIVAPDDSAFYRSYLITTNSGPGDKDYDEWPSKWGAPIHRDGSPKLTGDIMLWTIYNDAHPEVHAYQEQPPNRTFIEVHETIWSYNQSGILGDVMFLKWQIYNKGKTTLDSIFVCHWNDIDLYWSETSDLSGYDFENKYGYVYNKGVSGRSELNPKISSYILLQGPIVQNDSHIGYSFGKEIVDHSNLPTTGYWGIIDDATKPDVVGENPKNLKDVYFFASGRRQDGSPIINPINGDTTNYTYTGNPVTKEGWLMEGSGGMCGYFISSGPFTMAPNDSQEIIIALTVAVGDSLKDAFYNLNEKIEYIRNFYQDSLRIIPEEPPLIPESFILNQNYPNPFNSETNIEYSIPYSGEIKISFYNILGEEIETIIINHNEPGNNNIKWVPTNISTGIYFYKVQFDNLIETKKCLYLK